MAIARHCNWRIRQTRVEVERVGTAVVNSLGDPGRLKMENLAVPPRVRTPRIQYPMIKSCIAKEMNATPITGPQKDPMLPG
jgi:hypothetical protein